MAGRQFTERPQSGWTGGTGPTQSRIYSIYSQALGCDLQVQRESALLAGWQQASPGVGAGAEAGLLGGTQVLSSSACSALGLLESQSPAVRGWSLG